MKLPERILCPHCEDRLILDPEEQASGKYECPNCERVIDDHPLLNRTQDAEFTPNEPEVTKPTNKADFDFISVDEHNRRVTVWKVIHTILTYACKTVVVLWLVVVSVIGVVLAILLDSSGGSSSSTETSRVSGSKPMNRWRIGYQLKSKTGYVTQGHTEIASDKENDAKQLFAEQNPNASIWTCSRVR